MGNEFVKIYPSSLNRIAKQKTTAKVVFCFLCLAFALPQSAVITANQEFDNPLPSEESAATAYLANGDEFDRPHKEPDTSFGCEDKIFAVAELENYAKGKYEFSVRWIDPAGITREHTRYPFHINNPKTRLWSWLSLRRGAGAGMLQWLDPAAGLEEFIGPWEIKVEVNDKSIANLHMEVNC